VEPARGLIDLAAELATRMECRQDHLEGRLFGKFRVRVDRDAAPVVAHGERAVRGELDVDEGGMARHGLVHGIVEKLGGEVMQG